MPQVPVGNEQQITKVQAAPNVRVSTDAPLEAFGGGGSAAAAGQAAVGLGKQAFDIAHEEKQKADDVATTEAYTKTVALRNQLMYDSKSGAMNRKGKDAFGVSEEYGNKFKQGADAIQESLTSDDQREMYNKIRANEQRDLDSSLTKHTFMEAQAYDKETTVASLATAREDAVMNYQNPGKVQESLNMQKALIESHATRNGLPPEAVKQQLMDATSKTHEGVINRMLANGQDLAASKYYKEVKPLILGSDATQLEKALEEGTIRGSSQREALAIVGKGDDLTASMQAVDKIKDPKIQDATRERVKQRFQERETATKYASEQNFRTAYTIAEKTRSKDSIPPDVWQAMEPHQRASVDAYLKKPDAPTNWNEYYNLKTMAGSTALRDKFVKTDLMTYRHQLADPEFKELVQAQAEARKGDTKIIDGFRNDQQIVNDALAEAGIDHTPKQGSNDAKLVNRFRKKVDEQVQSFAETNGKKPNNGEMQQIVDTLMVKGVTEKGFFWNTSKRVFELERGVDKHFDFDVKDVPNHERQKIESALKANGIEVTDDLIVQYYRRAIAGTVKRGS